MLSPYVFPQTVGAAVVHGRGRPQLFAIGYVLDRPELYPVGAAKVKHLLPKLGGDTIGDVGGGTVLEAVVVPGLAGERRGEAEMRELFVAQATS